MDRDTKDSDVFVMPDDVERTLALMALAGYKTAVPFPHWLGKVHLGEHLLDIVFSSGNAVARVDQDWFTYAVEDHVLGMRLLLCPPEESLWTKAFVQERERFDGADVMHLLRTRGATLDWERLLSRFGEQWPVLLAHLVTYRFVYPEWRDNIPPRVLGELTNRLLAQHADPGNPLCNGTLLSREQYLPGLEPLRISRRAAGSAWTDDARTDCYLDEGDIRVNNLQVLKVLTVLQVLKDGSARSSRCSGAGGPGGPLAPNGP